MKKIRKIILKFKLKYKIFKFLNIFICLMSNKIQSVSALLKNNKEENKKPEKDLNLSLNEENNISKEKEKENDEKKSSTIDDEIMEAIKKSKEINKTITKKAKFAGQEISFQKELNDQELKKIKDKEKKKTHQGLDDLIDSLAKNKDINVIDKSKIDWQKFVDKKKIERELEFNRKDGQEFF